MPTYEYECQSCGLSFSKMKKISQRDDPEVCGACSSRHVKRSVTSAGFSFEHTPKNGLAPQNTGVHSIDYNFDKVVGEDSARKWKVIQDRQAYKRGVIRNNPGTTGHDLCKTIDGDYKIKSHAEATQIKSAKDALSKLK